jgi:hypothetical protein
MLTLTIPVEIDGTTIFVEATTKGGDEEIAAVGFPSFTAALKPVTKIAQEITKSLGGLQPGRVAVEFGCQFAIESGQLTALIVSGSGSGSLKITLEWTK